MTSLSSRPRPSIQSYFLIVLSLLILSVIVISVCYSEHFSDNLYRITAFAFLSLGIMLIAFSSIDPTRSLICLLFVFLIGARLSSVYTLSICGISISPETLIIFVISLVYFPTHMIPRETLSRYWLAFVVSALAVYFVHPTDVAASILIGGIITQFLVYLLFLCTFQTIEQLKRLAFALIIFLCVAMAYGFLQPFVFRKWNDYFFLRIPSFFYNPIIYASVLLLLWPMVFAIRPRRLSRKLIVVGRVVFLSLCMLAILLTGSRGALLVALCQVFILFLLYSKRSSIDMRIAKRVMIFILIGVVALFLWKGQAITESVLRRFYQIDFHASGNSADERVLGVRGAIELGFRCPLFGVGLGQFGKEYPTTNAFRQGLLSLESAHNLPLNILAEGGFIMFLLWMAIIVVLVLVSKKALAGQYKTKTSNMVISLCVSQVGMILYTSIFYGEFLHRSNGLPMMLWCVVMAMLVNLARKNDIMIRNNRVEACHFWLF